MASHCLLQPLTPLLLRSWSSVELSKCTQTLKHRSRRERQICLRLRRAHHWQARQELIALQP